jgi:hypothetical protein
MAISQKYFKYLKHFKNTNTLIDFKSNNVNSVALRHDVDHSLDAALEMAFFENYHGFKSTYFLLPYSSYWDDKDFFKKVSQIEDFGHEIGLHFNGIADWFVSRTDDIRYDLKKIINKFNQNNIKIYGISSHGDPLCYQYNFINYWAFVNIKPKNPNVDENGRTAEGVIDLSGKRVISYPDSDEIKRADGKKFKLWSLDYKKLTLQYHAWHLEFDKYFSDSGGSWERTGDPLKYNITNSRTQVLIHPEYWLDKPKVYFFLGPARSGSTWLTKIINNSTNISARHEYLLNQEFYNKETKFKNTHKIYKLQNNKNFVINKFIDFWEEVSNSKKSIAEINIYLECFIDDLRKIFPDAFFIHIKRKPHEVISSLINRGWYKNYPDFLRPKIFQKIKSEKIFYLSNKQFVRVLSYFTQVRNNLNNKCNYDIDMNKAFNDINYLKKKLFKLGIYLYPLLIENYRNKLNLNKEYNYPYYSEWDIEKKKFYKKNISSLDRLSLIKSNASYDLINKLHINFNDDGHFFKSRLIKINKESFFNFYIFKKFKNIKKIEVLISLKLSSKNQRRIPLFLNEYKSQFYKKFSRRNLAFLSNSQLNYSFTTFINPRTKYFNFEIPKNYIINFDINSFDVRIFGHVQDL